MRSRYLELGLYNNKNEIENGIKSSNLSERYGSKLLANTDIDNIYLPYFKPKKHRPQRELDSLEQYLLEMIATNLEGVTPVIAGERVVYVPDRQFVTLAELPQDVRGIVTQLGEDEIGDSNLRELLWYLLNGRALQMKLPVVDSKGGVAILVSTALNEDEPQESLYWNELIGRFYYNLFKRLRYFDGVELGREPVLKIGATTEDLKEVIHNPYFSSVVTAGHGRYGVWGATDKPIDWAHVADYSKGAGHLKSGFWVHLSCLAREDEEPLTSHVPFPYFAMRDPNNILGLQDGRGSNGYFYVEELVGVNGHQTVEPVKLRRITHDSFLPRLEAWKKVLEFNDLVEKLFEIGNEWVFKWEQTQDPLCMELGKYLLESSVKLQFTPDVMSQEKPHGKPWYKRLIPFGK